VQPTDVKTVSSRGWPGLIRAYGHLLPVDPATPIVTLSEGNTPLVPSRALGARIGRQLWFKVEGANPTGSFKDRGMTVAVSRALSDKTQGLVCASTGNTAASAAAFAARAGLPCVVIVPATGVAAASGGTTASVHESRRAFSAGEVEFLWEKTCRPRTLKALIEP
jgi:threonine synthase